MAWRQAEAMTAKSLKPFSMGRTTEGFDEPLDETQAKSVEDTSTPYYHTRMCTPDTVGRDIILGTIDREFQTRNPNM